MISFSPHDFKRTIHLLQQDDAHHLVWKGHFTERQRKITAS